MYASERHLYGLYGLTESQNLSQQAAERSSVLQAVAERRRERASVKREARRQRRNAVVPASATT
jgi:hypothetical protein